jgi:hypothetical protein
LAPDWIKDLKATDVFLSDGANLARATETNVTSGAATISAKGVATFDEVAAADKDSFLKVVNLVDAVVITEGHAAAFAYGSDVYMFIDTGANTNDLVIKVTGSISLPLVSLDATGATGLTGFSS